jgi:hypothetical protein
MSLNIDRKSRIPYPNVNYKNDVTKQDKEIYDKSIAPSVEVA